MFPLFLISPCCTTRHRHRTHPPTSIRTNRTLLPTAQSQSRIRNLPLRPSSLHPTPALVPSLTQTPLPTNSNQNLPSSPIPLPLPAPSHSSSFLFTPICVGILPLCMLSAFRSISSRTFRTSPPPTHVPHQKDQTK
ncbi:hypothetical protein M422DRAFT_258003 [Sphaerobolus stellatus SS14]|uniref:Unplaced genomic scaffold SPHSTscaffold_79, whole genome shotgun sequence n=1 Tax=Sphaerobolus stellatus (strain SS14) TaxID=990650 RepID=A0A0C9U7X9_SPHS4|nr:hypothetical protein M422DRAFT_258003 [Sphaerobolus stellatus SS14]